jgi:hypothetical protein
MGWVIRILPKIGPLKTLAFKVLTPAAERLFLISFDDTQQRYHILLSSVGQDRLSFQNENFDIGKPTQRGEYHLADETYDRLLDRLRDNPGQVSAALRADILRFYGASGQPASPDARSELLALRQKP